MEEMLTLNGATTSLGAESPQDLAIATEDPPNEQGQRRMDRRTSALQDFFTYDEVKESPATARNTLLVIAALITTATYQAVLSPPGSVWQDDYWPDAAAINITTKQPPPHTAGKSVMGTHYTGPYSMFLFFNSMGFFMSLYMIAFLMEGFPLQLELGVALVSLMVTYDVSMVTMSLPDWLSLPVVFLSLAMPLLIPTLIMVVRSPQKLLKKLFSWFR